MAGPDDPKPELERRAAEGEQPRPVAAPEGQPVAADARKTEADKAAEDLTDNPAILLPKELAYVDKRFEEARKAVEKIYDALPKAIADTERVAFKEDILERVLSYALYDIRDWWKNEVRSLVKSGGGAIAVINLRKKYFISDDKDGESLMGKAVQLCDLYLHKLVENDGAITGNTLIKMLDSASQQAAIYVDLLKSGKYKDVVQAITDVLGGTDKGIESAMKTLEKRLKSEFPVGQVMQPLWMAISFLPEVKRIELATKYKKTNPGKILAFLEEGNKMGVFSPDEMQKILGRPLDEGKKALYATLWTKQHRFTEQVGNMARKSYGSRNPVNEKMTLFGTLGLVAKGAAWGTIAGNAIVTGYVHMKGKGFLGGLGAIPAAAKATAGVTAVQVASAGLGISHYWQKSKRNPESKIPHEKEEMRAFSALNQVKKGSGLWEEWNAFFKSGPGDESFEGGLAFSGFVSHVLRESKTFGDPEKGPLPEKKLTAANFLQYLKDQQTKAEPDQKLDYVRLIRKFSDKLVKSDDENIKLLARAFYSLKIGGVTGRSTYDDALDELPKLAM